MSDADLKAAMKVLGTVAGLTLSDQEIDRALASFKGHLAAIDAASRAELAREDEPSHVFRLTRDSRVQS